MKCPICGRENFEPNHFCYNCGYCLDSSLKSLKHMRRDRTTYFAVIILLAILCIGLAGATGYLGIRYRNLTRENRAVKAEQIAAQEAYDELYSRVFVPYDGSYTYHRSDCPLIDTLEVPVYVADEDEAIGLGCAPCPGCMQ